MLYAKILKIIIYKNLKSFVNLFSRSKVIQLLNKADSAIVYPAAAAFKLRLVVR
jgi:hypothetical protein